MTDYAYTLGCDDLPDLVVFYDVQADETLTREGSHSFRAAVITGARFGGLSLTCGQLRDAFGSDWLARMDDYLQRVVDEGREAPAQPVRLTADDYRRASVWYASASICDRAAAGVRARQIMTADPMLSPDDAITLARLTVMGARV